MGAIKRWAEIVVESRSFDIDGETSIDTGPADTDQ